MRADRHAVGGLPSAALPLAVGAAAVGGYLYFRRRDDRDPDAEPVVMAAPAVPPPPPPGRWVWPVPRWRGRAPVCSDGWGSPRRGDSRGTIHRGVDIMYRRRTLSELADVFPPRKPHSLWHFMPPGTLALAAADGEVWSARRTPRGHTVVISHGAPWAT